jgi:hypothetical protein
MLLLLLANDPGRAEQVRSALRCRGAIERQHIPTLRSSSHRVQQQRLARTKTIGSALAQHFAGEVTALAACSKITRPDGWCTGFSKAQSHACAAEQGMVAHRARPAAAATSRIAAGSLSADRLWPPQILPARPAGALPFAARTNSQHRRSRLASALRLTGSFRRGRSVGRVRQSGHTTRRLAQPFHGGIGRDSAAEQTGQPGSVSV